MKHELLNSVVAMSGTSVGANTSSGRWWLPEDVSTTGHHIDHLFNVVMLETGVAFAAVVLLLVY